MIKELMHDPIFLSDFGEMCVADKRFKKNIDKCGDGTVELFAKAIVVFCQEK